MKTREFRDECINKYVIPAVKRVREDLARKYDITSCAYFKYKGLSKEACQMLSTRIDVILINEKSESGKYLKAEVEYIHGEQKHLPTIQTKYWVLEHTWMKVTFFDMINDIQSVLYIDPTCDQFDEYYADIPEFYVSPKPPKWFYSDKRNPAFYPYFTRKINESIKFHNIYIFTVKHRGELINMGIIEFFQYKIWGGISQFIWEHIPRYAYMHID